jgi:SAM-dependent methyltransferase
MLVGSAASARQGVISEASLRRQERLLLSTAFSPPFDYPLQPHPNVRSGALRHALNLDRFLASPLHQPTVEAFDATLEWIGREDPNGDRSIILDSGCGTGRSTRLAALAEPAALVLGVDRSEQRLERGSSAETPRNARLVRAELGSFWRLLLAAEDGRLA